jgi:predicted RNA polymerase sigma factor
LHNLFVSGNIGRGAEVIPSNPTLELVTYGRFNLVKNLKNKGILARRFEFQKVKIHEKSEARKMEEKLAVLQNRVDDCTLKKELQLLFLCYTTQHPPNNKGPIW